MRETTVVFNGDSIIQMWGFVPTGGCDATKETGDLGSSFSSHNLVLINTAANGKSTEELLRDFPSSVLKYHPDVAIIEGGSADLASGRNLDPVLIEYNIERMVSIATARHIRPIIFLVPPTRGQFGFLNPLINKTNELRLKFIRDNQLQGFMINQMLSSSDGELREEFDYCDGLHLSPAAYKLLSENLRNFL